MENKLDEVYPTDYNLLIAQGLCQVLCQIVLLLLK